MFIFFLLDVDLYGNLIYLQNPHDWLVQLQWVPHLLKWFFEFELCALQGRSHVKTFDI